MKTSNICLYILFVLIAFDFQGCSMIGCAARGVGDDLREQLKIPDREDGPLITEGKAEGEIIDALKARLARREEAAAVLSAEIKLLKTSIKRERTEASLATMRTIAWWLVAVSVIALIGFVFLKVWLKGVLSGLTTAGLVTFGLLLTVCGVFLYFGAALLWIAFLAGLFGLLVLAIWGGKRLLDMRKAVASTASFAEQLMGHITDSNLLGQLKKDAAAAQDSGGVRALIAAVRQKPIK